jgi:hypothetical protein
MLRSGRGRIWKGSFSARRAQRAFRSEKPWTGLGGQGALRLEKISCYAKAKSLSFCVPLFPFARVSLLPVRRSDRNVASLRVGRNDHKQSFAWCRAERLRRILWSFIMMLSYRLRPYMLFTFGPRPALSIAGLA